MKKLIAAFLLGVASFSAFGVYASDNSSSTEPVAQTQQVVPCAPQNYCGPQTCTPAPCYTDSVCVPTQGNPVPCANVPVNCYQDSVCNPAPCFAPVQAPAKTNVPTNVPTNTTNNTPVVYNGCGGC